LMCNPTSDLDSNYYKSRDWNHFINLPEIIIKNKVIIVTNFFLLLLYFFGLSSVVLFSR
jgi:hypothetical protein